MPVDVRELPDGTLLIAGTDPWLHRLDAGGKLLETWAGTCSPGCEVEAMALGTDAVGDPLVALTGFQTGADRDPFDIGTPLKERGRR